MKPSIALPRRIWELLERAGPPSPASRAVDATLMTLIALNIVAVVLESVESLQTRWAIWFTVFEWFSVAVFTVEYAARLWTCTSEPRYGRGIVGRLRYAVTPLALVDLLAILPAYLPLLGVDLRVLRGLRLLRLFRIAKAGRYSGALPLVLRVVRSRRAELGVCVAFMSVLLCVCGTVMYFLEHDAQPDKFPNIPAALWWAIATLTTVGYGDVVPVTTLGKLAAGMVGVLGISFFALPTSILGAGFLEELKHTGKPHGSCPRCGYRL